MQDTYTLHWSRGDYVGIIYTAISSRVRDAISAPDLHLAFTRYRLKGHSLLQIHHNAYTQKVYCTFNFCNICTLYIIVRVLFVDTSSCQSLNVYVNFGSVCISENFCALEQTLASRNLLGDSILKF